MKPGLISLWLALAAAGCGYNLVIDRDEDVKAAWAEVENQYQRRADLVPNLVATVQGAADFERETLEAVVQARARATQVRADPAILDDPARFREFERAQADLSGALSRLLVTVERYPQLGATAAFRDLQAQLEGTENRIAVARNRYIKAVQDFNVTVRSFPSNLTAMAFGFKTKPNFTVENERELAKPPKVDFNPKK